MKKLGFWLAAILFVIAGCAVQQSNTQVVPDYVKGIISVSYDQLIQKIENNHEFLLYIGRADCGDCIEFYPQLENYMKEHPDSGIFYLDVKAFRDAAKKEDATEEEKAFFEGIYDTLEFDWTPTLQHRIGGVVVDKITYLDMDFYQIEDKQEQEKAKKASLEAIWQWLEEKNREVDSK